MSLQLGEMAPDFQSETSKGPISFYDWAGDNWVVLFSHPADFTPVCTTELGRMSQLQEDFLKRHAKIIAVSVDTAGSHKEWIRDINEVGHTDVQYPIIGDPERKVAGLYKMIHPKADDTHTVRTVFIIDPQKKVRMTLTYPAATGRNFKEILRVLDSLQLTDQYSVSTPVEWEYGDDVIVGGKIKTEDIAHKFPKGHKVIKSYLRTTPQPDLN